MPQERATSEEHAREIKRMHTLIEHIQKQAAKLQEATHHLPEKESEALSEKADTLAQQADDLLEAVEELESHAN